MEKGLKIKKLKTIRKEDFLKYLALRANITTTTMADMQRCADKIGIPITAYRTIFLNFAKLYTKFYGNKRP